MTTMDIRVIEGDGMAEAVRLVTEVFMEYEAPEYSQQGVDAFFNTALNNESFMASLTLYGAYIDGSLAGVLATRSVGSHIALFFVDGARHRQGIGRRLFNAALAHCEAGEMTVNSSPYAREVYHHLGFEDTADEQTVTGIRFTPMIYRKRG